MVNDARKANNLKRTKRMFRCDSVHVLTTLLLLFPALLSRCWGKASLWKQWSHEDQALHAELQDLAGVEPAEDSRNPFPIYHYRMLNDKIRNDAFYHTIKEEIERRKGAGKPTKVLDIGAGLMLLSMIAAKEGADSVTAIERNAELVALGDKLIKKNGVFGKIFLIEDESFNVVAEDYPHLLPADILVSETLDSWVIGEGWLSSLNDAKARGLVAPDATIVPARGKVWMQLTETTLSMPTPAILSGGLDFELLRKKRPRVDMIGNYKDNVKATLSEPVSLFNFEFQNLQGSNFFSPLSWTMRGRVDGLFDHTVVKLPITNNGTLHAIVFWFDVDVDNAGKHSISCEPGSLTHWQQMIHLATFPERVVEPGDVVTLEVARIAERYIIVNRDDGERLMIVHSHCKNAVKVFIDKLHYFTLGAFGEYNIVRGRIGEKVQAVYKSSHNSTVVRVNTVIETDEEHDNNRPSLEGSEEEVRAEWMPDLRVLELCTEEREAMMEEYRQRLRSDGEEEERAWEEENEERAWEEEYREEL